MAIAGYWQAAHFNRPGYELFDYDVYALCGDGDMMEGITSEAASLAGHLRLANLCWIYDNNHISIEGSTSLAFSDDVATRFIGNGWNVTRVGDANDREMLGARVRDVQERVRAADADHRRQPHRLRRADQAGHRVGARRAARRRGGQAHQEGLRLAGGRAVPRPRRRARALRGQPRRARPDAARGVDGALRALPGGAPRPRRPAPAHAAPRAARRLGLRDPRVPARREGSGFARVLGSGA